MPALLFFLASACFGLAGLCTIALRKVPAITWTVAFIAALAAIGAAIPH
ncbi:hypothetical protein ACFRH6_14425 [Streptomyces sp. NPDC056749]